MAKYKVEDAISELASYVDSCKNVPLSSTKIVCEREQLEDMINSIKKNLPKELEYCRDVMARSEAIEREAKDRANRLIENATAKTTELLSENEINQQAIKRADEIVRDAAEQGQQIYDEYIREGNMYREQAQRYLTDMLGNLQELIYSCIDTTSKNTNKLLDSLNRVGTIVSDNLNELNAPSEAEMAAMQQTGSIDVNM